MMMHSVCWNSPELDCLITWLLRNKGGLFMDELEVVLGSISIDSLPPNESLTGVPNKVEEFWKKERPFVESILAAGVCVPILMGEWHNEFFLIAGRRRIMGARTAIWLVEQEKVPKPSKTILNQIYHLSSKTYRNISPEDRDKITLIENMHRSDNPIQTWIIIRELEKAGRWDEVGKQI